MRRRWSRRCTAPSAASREHGRVRHAAGRLAACGSGGVFPKRIVGLPHEVVGERNGTITIGGRTRDGPYVGAGRDLRTVAPMPLGRDEYSVLGDNRSQSCDSRNWGPVRRRAIIGRVAAVYWPLSRVRGE